MATDMTEPTEDELVETILRSAGLWDFYRPLTRWEKVVETTVQIGRALFWVLLATLWAVGSTAALFAVDWVLSRFGLPDTGEWLGNTVWGHVTTAALIISGLFLATIIDLRRRDRKRRASVRRPINRAHDL